MKLIKDLIRNMMIKTVGRKRTSSREQDEDVEIMGMLGMLGVGSEGGAQSDVF